MAAIEATDLHEGPTAPVWRLLGDDALARAAGRGNDHAFAALYARYSKPLRGYCASILLNPEDAEDAVQATMLKAMRALPARRPGLPVRPWLYRIAHNESVDVLRRRRATKDVDDVRAPVMTSAGPEADLARRERLAELVVDLRTLPERQRAALVMRELSGLGYDEIAGALDVTPGAVRQLVFEARTTLHEFERGRDTACAAVQRSLSDADRRRRRARSVRAHLRSCNTCRAFDMAIGRREQDLAALPPMLFEGTAALAVAAGGILGIGLVGGGTVASVVSGAAAKGIAAAALAIAVGTGAAIETGVAPIGLRQDEPAARRAASPPPRATAAPAPGGAQSVRREAARTTGRARPARERRPPAVRALATLERDSATAHVPRMRADAPAPAGVAPPPAAVTQPAPVPSLPPRPSAPAPRATAQPLPDPTREHAASLARQATQRAIATARAVATQQQSFIERTLQGTQQASSRVRELVARLTRRR